MDHPLSKPCYFSGNLLAQIKQFTILHLIINHVTIYFRTHQWERLEDSLAFVHAVDLLRLPRRYSFPASFASTIGISVRFSTSMYPLLAICFMWRLCINNSRTQFSTHKNKASEMKTDRWSLSFSMHIGICNAVMVRCGIHDWILYRKKVYVEDMLLKPTHVSNQNCLNFLSTVNS